MRESVEQVGNLLALHNLTEQNLLDTIRLGGFPMPSIAVVKADAGHSKYGPISIVLSSGSIDPEADSRNHVYGGDAWTPTAPNVEYPVNSKKARQVEQMLDQQAKKVAGGIFGNTSVLRAAGIDESSSMSAETMAITRPCRSLITPAKRVLRRNLSTRTSKKAVSRKISSRRRRGTLRQNGVQGMCCQRKVPSAMMVALWNQTALPITCRPSIRLP